METTGPTIEHMSGGRQAPQPPAGNDRIAPPQTSTLRNRRKWRPGLLVVGLILVIGSMLGGLLLFDSVTTTTSVLVAARDLESGQVLDPNVDVTTIEIVLPAGVPALTFDERAFLAGADGGQPVRALTGPIQAGTILHEGFFENRSDLVEPGQALFGMSLATGEFPTQLRLGDRVEIFRVDPRGSAEEGVLVGQAEIWRILQRPSEANPNFELVVDLLIDQPLSEVLVQAESEGALRLTVVRG